jgi:hypothetical protein
MVYKLLVWKKGSNYIACFPEVDSGMIIHGPDKEKIKEELIQRTANYLKTLETPPENKDLEKLMDIVGDTPEKYIKSISGVEFN